MYNVQCATVVITGPQLQYHNMYGMCQCLKAGCRCAMLVYLGHKCVSVCSHKYIYGTPLGGTVRGRRHM